MDLDGNERMGKLYAYFEQVQGLQYSNEELFCQRWLFGELTTGIWVPTQLPLQVTAEKNLGRYLFDQYGHDLQSLKQVLVFFNRVSDR